MAIADARPVFSPDGAPVSVLVDFDGTISLEDVTDHLLDTYGADRDWRRRDAEYLRDEAGTRELIEWDLSILDADEATLRREAERQRLDPGFATLAESVRRHGGAIEVVSDGLGFYVAAAIERLGCADVPVATAEFRFGRIDGPADDGARPAEVDFPFGHPACFVCGTCKRERVRAHQSAGHLVVFVGDGQSDRYGAHHAEIVFAKRRLAAVRDAEGAPYLPWERLVGVAGWINSAFEDGRLPASASELDAWRASRRAAPVGFMCGPEVWGPGRATPDGDEQAVAE